ncbi:MAG: hypothetical protein EXS15_01740 [Phycisphaerales bacterium]|nr:hypothetical protein [Phycisphaerales bacterium]
MSRSIRKIVLGALVLTALCVVAAILFCDAVAARMLATSGSHVLGVDTTVRSVHLGIFDGRSTLNGLRVSQPSGFGEGAMFTVERASVAAGVFELFGRDIVLESVEIDGIHVYLVESGGLVNLQVVAQKVVGNDSVTHPAPPSNGDAGTVTIRQLRVTNIRVSATGGSVLGEASVDVTLQDLVINDVGSKTPFSEIAQQLTVKLMDTLTTAIIAAKIKGLPMEFATGLETAASTLTDLTKSILNESGGAIKSTIDGAGKALQDLFGR